MMEKINLKKFILIGHILFWALVLAQDLVIFVNPKFVVFHAEAPTKEYRLIDLFLGMFNRLFVFYFNYFVLTPLLLKRRKFIAFILSIPLVFFILELVYYLSDDVYLPLQDCIECGVLSVLGILTNLLISSLARYLTDWIKYFEQNKKVQLRNKEMQISLLKNQINPHFFFNNLNSLYSLCLNDDKDAGPMVLKLASIMRYLIYEGTKSEISLSSEVGLLRDFVDLQSLKKPKSSHVEFYEEGIEKHHKIAPLLLINFMENAYKHSNIFLEENSFIDVSIIVNNEELFFVIENSVSDRKSQNVSSGIGLDNLQKQLELLYPDRFELSFSSLKHSFKVSLRIKL